MPNAQFQNVPEKQYLHASMDDDDAKPVFCDTNGKNLGQKVFRVATGPIDK